jgi:hypothetical protein
MKIIVTVVDDGATMHDIVRKQQTLYAHRSLQ